MKTLKIVVLFGLTIWGCDSTNEVLNHDQPRIEIKSSGNEHVFVIHSRAGLAISDFYINGLFIAHSRDTAMVTNLSVGRRTLVITLRDTITGAIQRLDTTFVVGKLSKSTPDSAIFPGCRVKVEFVGDHITDDSDLSVYYGIEDIAHGQWGAIVTDSTYFMSESFTDQWNNRRREWLSWLLNPSRSQLDSLMIKMDVAIDGTHPYYGSDYLNIRGVNLFGVNDTCAVYLRDLEPEPKNFSFRASFSQVRPPGGFKYVSTDWSSTPKPYVQITFSKMK